LVLGFQELRGMGITTIIGLGMIAGCCLADPQPAILADDTSNLSAPTKPLAIDFFEALSVKPLTEPPEKVAPSEAEYPRFSLLKPESGVNPINLSALEGNEFFLDILDEHPDSTKGLYRDPDRWRYKVSTTAQLFKRSTIIETPQQTDIRSPYAGRNWNAEEKLQIPIPISTPLAEQMFVLGQFNGSGDSLNNQQTTITGKTMVGMKWMMMGQSELQLRYGTIFNADGTTGQTRFIEKTQPAVELLARMPLLGPWSIEYTGSALAGLTPLDRDQLRQELRLAVPLGRGDDEFEFGARYRWEVVPAAMATPWTDRAQLFMGIKFRR
jgi:hypothetical protein